MGIDEAVLDNHWVRIVSHPGQVEGYQASRDNDQDLDQKGDQGRKENSIVAIANRLKNDSGFKCRHVVQQHSLTECTLTVLREPNPWSEDLALIADFIPAGGDQCQHCRGAICP